MVPSHIKRPPYAASPGGDPGPSKSSLVRSPQELQAMRKAGQLAAKILIHAGEAIAPGITTDSIDALVHEETLDGGAYPSPLNYRGFPKSVCTSVNEVICHGIPDSRALLETDIINVDVTVYLDGVHGDTSATFFVGRPKDELVARLVTVTYESLYLGIDAVRPGASVSDIGRAIEQKAKSQGLGVVREFIGHSIGTEFHSKLAIPHYFDKSYSTRLEPNMTFTIEPMLSLGSPIPAIWPDDWTAVTEDGCHSAQFEHTLAVTESGVEILTQTESGECAHTMHLDQLAQAGITV